MRTSARALILATLLLASCASGAPARVEGPDSFALARASASRFATHAAILVADGDEVEAVGAAGFSGVLGMPVLFTSRSEVSPDARKALDAIGSLADVYVLGNESEIGAPVFSDLKQRYAKATVKRYGEVSPYATAEKLGHEIGAGLVDGVRTAIVVNGNDLEFALGAIPLAFVTHIPVVFVTAAAVPAETKRYMAWAKIQHVIAIGPEAEIGAGVANELQNETGAPVTRIAGIDAPETAAAAGEAAKAYGISPAHVVIGTADDIAPAIIAAYLAGSMKATLLLVHHDSVPGATHAWLATNCAQVQDISIVGGTDLIPQSVENELGCAP